MAMENGWPQVELNDHAHIVSFMKNGVRINVYYDRMPNMVVGTCMFHPMKGMTQLFRRNINFPLLREIFKNPRVHTHLGYYRKPWYPKTR